MDRADCRGAGGLCCSFSREGFIILVLFVDSNLLTRNYLSVLMSICSLYDFSVSKFNSFIADKLNFYLYFLIIDLIIELVDDAFVTKTGRGVQIKLSRLE